MTRHFPSADDVYGGADRIARVRARMAAGVRYVEPTPEPKPSEPPTLGKCFECGLPVIRLDAGLVCKGQPYPDHKPRLRPFTEKQLQARVARLVREVESAARTAVAESRGTLGEDDAFHDCGLSLAMMYPESVRARFFAGQLGWIPEEDADADLFRRENTDPRLAG